MNQIAETSNSQTSTSDNVKTCENKTEKHRPLTKVVIRRLPPTLTQEQFLEQVSPLPEYDYLHFAKADCTLGQNTFTRAYINFVNTQDVFLFREKFDNYVFLNAKGIEYPAVVEYAPFQRLSKKHIDKTNDTKCATIESDPYYLTFLESLKSRETNTTNTQPKMEYSYQPSDYSSQKVTTTPLLDYLKQQKQEKQRLRDERREEKRLRNLEKKRITNKPAATKLNHNTQGVQSENSLFTAYSNPMLQNMPPMKSLSVIEIKRSKLQNRYWKQPGIRYYTCFHTTNEISRKNKFKFPLEKFLIHSRRRFTDQRRFCESREVIYK